MRRKTCMSFLSSFPGASGCFESELDQKCAYLGKKITVQKWNNMGTPPFQAAHKSHLLTKTKNAEADLRDRTPRPPFALTEPRIIRRPSATLMCSLPSAALRCPSPIQAAGHSRHPSTIKGIQISLLSWRLRMWSETFNQLTVNIWSSFTCLNWTNNLSQLIFLINNGAEFRQTAFIFFILLELAEKRKNLSNHQVCFINAYI